MPNKPATAPSAESLRETHDSIWDNSAPYEEQPRGLLALRSYRAISWVGRAEQEHDLASPQESDPDAAFIFYWIAFNAAYASEIDSLDTREREEFAAYFQKLLGLDRLGTVYDSIWGNFSGPIRLLLDNKYLFYPFWQHANGKPGFEDWELWFSKDKIRVNKALAAEDTGVVLSVLFSRLYTLRNQLVHGGATWNSSVNRDSVKDGVAILRSLVPTFISLMMSSPEGTDWGIPYYPPQDARP